MPTEKIQNTTTLASESLIHPQVGRLAGVGPSGEVMVEFGKNSPKPARIVSALNRHELIKPESKGREVLLLFEGGDAGRPIITGLMESVLDDLVSMAVETEKPDSPVETIVDGKRLVFEAQNEIMLKCGKGSITINKDGKIIVKGTNLLSRSSGTNRIKGASVSVN